ncbi:DUF1559 domain-containing protein [Armatimonas sp.]|uniref:DUF1559 family PulG-like putative transporter n=1 Tax=Armatimonas sp. TaxID=1872638 RepID=UPI00375312F4
MNDDDAFFIALSHTSWGLVPFVVAVGLGVALYFLTKRWQDLREHRILLALIVLWLLFLQSMFLNLGGLMHFGCAQRVGRNTACRENMKQLGVAMMQYVQDYDGTFPPANSWEAALKPYLKTPLTCPAVKTKGSYGMNKALGGRKLAEINDPTKTVAFFETNALGPSFSGGVADMAKERHGGRSNVVFADGSTPTYPNPNRKEFIWDIPTATTKASPQ